MDAGGKRCFGHDSAYRELASNELATWLSLDSRQSRRGVPALRGVANRVDQATTNFLETFPFFTALVLITHVPNHHGALTIWVFTCISGLA